MASIIEMKVGSENFGISAGNGRLCLTLRAHYQEDLEMLTEAILAYARQQAETSGITMEVSETDAFPDTVNDTALTEKLEQLCIDHALPYTYLPGPMRWSEDFGWYQKKCRGVFSGSVQERKHPGSTQSPIVIRKHYLKSRHDMGNYNYASIKQRRRL